MDIASPSNADRFGNDLQRFQLATVLGQFPGGIDLLPIQILDIGRHVRGSPWDGKIAAQNDARWTWKRSSDCIVIAGREVREVPDGWQPRVEMRIVGEKWESAYRPGTVDHPVVGAKSFCS